MLDAVVFGSAPQQTKLAKHAERWVATSPPVCLPLFDLHGKEVYPELHSNPRQSRTIWVRAGKCWLLDQLCKSCSHGSIGYGGIIRVWEFLPKGSSNFHCKWISWNLAVQYSDTWHGFTLTSILNWLRVTCLRQQTRAITTLFLLLYLCYKQSSGVWHVVTVVLIDVLQNKSVSPLVLL